VAAIFLAYFNSISSPFLFDDQNSIIDNRQIRQLWPLTIPLSPPRDTPVAGRPVVNLSFAVNYALGGLRVEGYHLINIGIHVLAALTLFGIVRRTLVLPKLAPRFALASSGAAWASALIWGLHPLQTEAVNYLSERTESMMGLLYFLTLYASIRAVDERASVGWRAAAVAACALGMACKESMVTAPVIVVLFDRVFVFDSFREAIRRRWKLYVGLGAGWFVLAALMWSVPRTSIGFATETTPWLYLLNQLSMITRYLWLSVWPQSLVLDYGLPRPVVFRDVVVPGIVVAGLGLTTLVALVYRPMWGFLGVWFFITLAPTSSIIPIATEVGAERRMYVPLAALVVLGVVAWDRLVGRKMPVVSGFSRTKTNVAALTIICVLLTTGTFARNREYSSRLVMAQTIVDRRPQGRAHFELGSELINAGRHDEAMAQFRQSARDYPGGHFALGTELIAAGSVEEGIAELQTFIRELPSHPNVLPARELLGRALIAQRRPDQASEQFQLMLKTAPSHASAHRFLGDISLSAGNPEEARRHYEEVLRSQPENTEVLRNLGIALAASGRMDEAIVTFRRVVAVRPSDPVASNLLGRALASRGQFQEAMTQFRRALELDPSYAAARTNLASAEAALAADRR
jgi:Flp pilus assembly protein TadD